MKVYVKRSDLLHFHRSFYDSSTELNTIYLTLTPRDLFLLAKIFCSFFTKEICVRVRNDNQGDFKTSRDLGPINKDILHGLINSLDEQAVLSKDGNISIQLTNSLCALKAFEVLLLSKSIQNYSFECDQQIILGKLRSIERKCGYTNHKQELLEKNLSYLHPGDLVNVADDSGASLVKVIGEVAPFIYIVNVEQTKFKHRALFPHGKKYAAVLLSSLLPTYTGMDTVCLFEYYDGITKPLFTKVVTKNTFVLADSLDYHLIINHCLFRK